MTSAQKLIRYIAIALAACLIVAIVGGICGALGWIGGWLDSDAVLEEEKEYTASLNVTDLQISISAADLSIVRGGEQQDHFLIRSNLANLEVREENGVLHLTDSTKHANLKGATLSLVTPASTVFDTVKIEAGAGKLDVSALFVKTLDLDFGAGDVTFRYLSVSESANIRGGAGDLAILDGGISNLSLDMGVGALSLRACLSGTGEIDCGVGSADLVLLGDREWYSVTLDKGIGKVTVAGEKLKDGERYGDGPSTLALDTGVGSVTIDFEAFQEGK